MIGLKGNKDSLREDVELFFEKHRERGVGGDFVKKSECGDQLRTAQSYRDKFAETVSRQENELIAKEALSRLGR